LLLALPHRVGVSGRILPATEFLLDQTGVF
jgi:hypothetical protein